MSLRKRVKKIENTYLEDQDGGIYVIIYKGDKYTVQGIDREFTKDEFEVWKNEMDQEKNTFIFLPSNDRENEQ